MDRIIEVKVNGNYLTKDNRSAGVQHEANANKLRIEFDEGWDGYAKKVTFWNALGENPVERTLTADLLEDIAKSTRIYLCPIPGEAMDEAGELTFVIDGWVSWDGGIRQRSVEDHLTVKAASYIEQAGQPVDPTPTQAEQLQEQIDNLLGDIQEQAARAEFAASDAMASAERAANKADVAADKADAAAASESNAKISETNAKASETNASASAQVADSAATTVTALARAAKISETNAAASATASAASAKSASTSESNAKTSETRASSSANAAATSESNAKASEARAVSYANMAADREFNAAAHEDAALRAAGEAKAAGSDAEAWATGTRNGIAVGSSDPAFMNNAKYYKDQAQQISGGDFATKEYVDQIVQGLGDDIDCGTF